VIDASTDDFLLDVLRLVGDLNGSDQTSATAYDHAYAPSVRGGDAIHLLHYAALAYRFTGDEEYRRFLFEDLLGPSIRADEVALTTGALRLPNWCRSFYGDHITFSPLWSLITSLGDSPLRTSMQEAMKTELHDKLLFDGKNAKFDLQYAAVVPDSIAAGSRNDAINEGVALVRALGGNGGLLDDPRRSYPLPVADVLAQLPALGNASVCPTVDERHRCEDGVKLFGIQVPGSSITFPCTGAPGECVVGDACAVPLARDALPPSLRDYEDFLWQRNPYQLGGGGGGDTQSPGLDLTESYWLARHAGFIAEGKGQVLAWRPAGSCP
jgi:hypothetical protein